MRDGITCVFHPDTGLPVPARELTPEQYARAVALGKQATALMEIEQSSHGNVGENPRKE